MISKLLPCHRRIDTNYDRQPKSDFFATLQNAFLLVFALSVFSRLSVRFIDFSRHKIVYNQYEGHSPLKTWLHETFPILLRGLWSDIGFAVICAIGLTFAVLTVKRSGVAVAFALVLAVVYAANATHHLYNLSDLNFSDAPMLTDETFLTSALGIPWLWAFAAANFVFVGLISILCRRYSAAKIATYVCLAAGLLIIVFRPEYEVSQPDWMQKNLFLPASVGTHETLGYDVPDLVASIPSQPLDTPGHNLLVIYLEGVSALSIHADSMPFLHALKAEALTLDRYIGPQLLTSRGLYASLTSHMPGFAFGDTRWAALNVDSPERRTALPRAMSDAGYHSSFLQAAPLAFMQKDRILPLLGFDEVYGLEHVPGQEFDGFWGQSDVNFLARLGNHILETDAAQARWFIAGLTVGTHAPYIVDRPAGTTKTDRQLALAAADRALESLLKQLDSSGVLNNTVIAITADESREYSAGTKLALDMALNWLPLIILHPDLPPENYSGYVSSLSLAGLLKTLVGSEPESWKDDLRDQSVFAFGNGFSSKFFLFDSDREEFLTCRSTTMLCGLYRGVKDPLAHPPEMSPEALGYLPDLKRFVDELEGS